MLNQFLRLGCLLGLAGVVGCESKQNTDNTLTRESEETSQSSNSPSLPAVPEDIFAGSDDGDLRLLRSRMVEFQMRRRGIRDPRVLDALEKIPRHRFVPPELIASAYNDGPLPIGYGQTISQPYIVALMTEMVRPKPTDRALDIGTGCGYQAAVLAELTQEVYSIEIIESLARNAEARLDELGYDNISVRCGDGYHGWIEKAPFDIIVVAAAPGHVPHSLLDQLSLGGRLIIPVGENSQDLMLIEKREDGTLSESQVAAVRFVPMTGEAEQR